MLQRLFWVCITMLVVGVVGWQGWVWAARPSRTPQTLALADGIIYERIIRDEPRPIVLHVVEIDLSSDHVDFLVTPPDAITHEDHLHVRTTQQFAREFETTVAINGSFFYPFEPIAPFVSRPAPGEPATAIGTNISDGVAYGVPGRNNFRALCIAAEHVTIGSRGCPDGTEQALSGSVMLMRDGRVLVRGGRQRVPEPRTAVATDGARLWLIVVDGRQSGYSDGVMLSELAAFAQALGATDALNLDGGGSSTLVAQVNGRLRVLNAPIHTGVPGLQRPIANHLGVFGD